MCISDLIGKPYAVPCYPPDSYDCWELAVEVRRVLGLATPATTVPPANRRSKLSIRHFQGPEQVNWHQVETPRNGTMVGFGKKIIRHCGVWYNGRVIHAYADLGSVVYHDLHSLRVLGLSKPTYWERADD